MHTSLSRHLFRLDEVAAALRYSIVERRIEEGMYWTLELLDSSEYKLLFDTLLEVWLSAVGCARLGFLFEFSKLVPSLTKPSNELNDSLLTLSYNLLRVSKDCRDGSVLAIAIVTLEDFVAVANAGNNMSLDEQMSSLSLNEAASIGALKSKLYSGENPTTAIRAWLEIKSAGNLPVVNPIRRTAQAACRLLKDYKYTAGWKYIWICVETLILCMTDMQYTEAIRGSDMVLAIDAGTQESLQSWIVMTGRRKRRCFTIPKWCLKWCTERGRSTYQPMNIEEIRQPWTAMGRSAYWAQKATEFGCEIIGNEISAEASSDEAWEGFVNFAFPDDIPDEWSLEDQMKSHGEGVVAPGYAPSFSNWFRSWFPENSWASPGALSKINKIIEAAPIYPGVIWFDEWLSCRLQRT
jgi:hypothetical protein